MKFEDFKVGTVFYNASGKWECIGIDTNSRLILAKKIKHHPIFVTKLMRTNDNIFKKLKEFSSVSFEECQLVTCSLDAPEGMYYGKNSVLGFEYVV